MERLSSSASMEALDSLLFKASQFPRTDSEDQFRKFLERIPSASNLAAHGSMQSLPQAQQEQIQQQMAQLVSQGAPPLSTQLPEGGSLNVRGIPRVPSLDLLRQLVTQQQQQQQFQSPAPPASKPATHTPAVKEEVLSKPIATRPSLDALKPGAEPALTLSSSPLGLSLPLSLNNLAPAVPMPSPGGVAAPLLPGGLPQLPSQPAKASRGASAAAAAAEPAPTGKESKAEIRRARRMLSNRESARRSRRRKQEHLTLLEEQIQGLEEERDALQARVEKLERQAGSMAEANQSLRRENDDLRSQLGLEVREKKGGNPNKRPHLCNGH